MPCLRAAKIVKMQGLAINGGDSPDVPRAVDAQDITGQPYRCKSICFAMQVYCADWSNADFLASACGDNRLRIFRPEECRPRAICSRILEVVEGGGWPAVLPGIGFVVYRRHVGICGLVSCMLQNHRHGFGWRSAQAPVCVAKAMFSAKSFSQVR